MRSGSIFEGGWFSAVKMSRIRSVLRICSGVVYSGLFRAFNRLNITCAIKKVHILSDESRRACQEEIKIMATLNHPSTVRLLAFIDDSSFAGIGLVLELCVGDLQTYYSGKLDKQMMKTYSDQAGLIAARTVANGMACEFTA